MKYNEWGYDILKEFAAKISVFSERWAFKNQVTSVLCSTLDSCYWRDLYVDPDSLFWLYLYINNKVICF